MAAPDETNERQTIWLCRHGNRIDFVDSSWKGDDPHLSEDGIIQAKETGLRLKGEGIQHIFTSPFLRTTETAHHIAEALDLPIKIEHGASEWLNAEWFSERPVHIPLDELLRRFPRMIIGHGHSVTGMAKGFMGASCQISCGLCALVKVVRQEGRSTLELNGDVSHLSSGEKHSGQFNRESLDETGADAV